MILDRDSGIDDTRTGMKKVCTPKFTRLILPHQNQTHCFKDSNREYLILRQAQQLSPHFVCLAFDCTVI